METIQLPDMNESSTNEAIEAILDYKNIKSLPEEQKTQALEKWEKHIESHR